MRGIQNKKVISCLWRWKWASFRLRDILRNKSTKSHILMFHQIREKENDCVQGDYSVDVKRFEQIIDWNKQQGYQFLSIDEIENFQQTDGKHCYITFDDGYEDLLLALPILRKFQVPFCVYLITDRIGTPGYLNEQQIRKLADDPLCTIGSHTCSHPYTRYLTAEELKKELITSKLKLEDILSGKKVDNFAFPYGTILACSMLDRKYVKEAGYLTAVTTDQVSLRKRIHNYYALPRFDASRKDILEVI